MPDVKSMTRGVNKPHLLRQINYIHFHSYYAPGHIFNGVSVVMGYRCRITFDK